MKDGVEVASSSPGRHRRVAGFSCPEGGMKTQFHCHNSFLQLLAHRERSRPRLLAWSVHLDVKRFQPRWNLFTRPQYPYPTDIQLPAPEASSAPADIATV